MGIYRIGMGWVQECRSLTINIGRSEQFFVRENSTVHLFKSDQIVSKPLDVQEYLMVVGLEVWV